MQHSGRLSWTPELQRVRSSHIHYMLTELLTNSMLAVVQHHYAPAASPKCLPPVTVVIVPGEGDVMIRAISQ